VKIETNQVYVADSIEFLQRLPSGCAGLIIADPPYNLKIDRRFEVSLSYHDHESWLEWSKRWINESARVLSPDGNLFVYSIHNYAAFLHVHLYNLGMTYRRQIIWHYENGWSRYTNGPACHYESLLWFAHGPRSTFHPIREPYKSTARLQHKITKNGKIWTPNPAGRLAGDVWKFPTLAGRRFEKERVDHPTQKPLSISERIVRHFSNANDLVVVPFAGSGTECVAAKALGRKFVACDLNPRYVSLAQARLNSNVDGEHRVDVESRT
jgi:DNA modification methylase